MVEISLYCMRMDIDLGKPQKKVLRLSLLSNKSTMIEKEKNLQNMHLKAYSWYKKQGEYRPRYLIVTFEGHCF